MGLCSRYCSNLQHSRRSIHQYTLPLVGCGGRSGGARCRRVAVIITLRSTLEVAGTFQTFGPIQAEHNCTIKKRNLSRDYVCITGTVDPLTAYMALSCVPRALHRETTPPSSKITEGECLTIWYSQQACCPGLTWRNLPEFLTSTFLAQRCIRKKHNRQAS